MGEAVIPEMDISSTKAEAAEGEAEFKPPLPMKVAEKVSTTVSWGASSCQQHPHPALISPINAKIVNVGKFTSDCKELAIYSLLPESFTVD